MERAHGWQSPGFSSTPTPTTQPGPSTCECSMFGLSTSCLLQTASPPQYGKTIKMYALLLRIPAFHPSRESTLKSGLFFLNPMTTEAKLVSQELPQL